MVTLEQVKLLESKVGRALSYMESLAAENATLREKLDGYRRRIDELESIVLAFKEDQGRIEAGIVSALERLNQFEDAVERGITDARENVTTDAPASVESPNPEPTPPGEVTDQEDVQPQNGESEPTEEHAEDEEPAAPEKNGELDIF